jgi:GNAT superfamily N-acetyltransferase
MMAITIREVISKRMLRQFVYLPEKIHLNHKEWVPPVYMDDLDYFNSKKNSAFLHCDTILLLAYKGDKPVGRVMGIINRKYNKTHNEQHARFSYLETENDYEVYSALISAIENWARSLGMTHLIGPLAFSDKDPQGFLVEGFGQPVSIATNCNFSYMVDFTEQYGFQRKLDLVVYQIPVPDVLPPVVNKIRERYESRQTGLRIMEFTSRRKVRPYIRPVLNLVNETFTDIYGFFPFSEKEMDDMANRYLYLIDPRYIKIIVNADNDVIAFVLGMADLSEGFRRANGRLLPYGFIHLLRAARKTKQLNLLLGAIRPDYQGRGLDMLMGAKLIESARATGKTVMDSHLELETNVKVRAEMERMGGKIYKRYRIWEKELLVPFPEK